MILLYSRRDKLLNQLPTCPVKNKRQQEGEGSAEVMNAAKVHPSKIPVRTFRPQKYLKANYMYTLLLYWYIRTYIHTNNAESNQCFDAHDIKKNLMDDSKTGSAFVSLPQDHGDDKWSAIIPRSLKAKKRPKLTADVVLRQQGYYVHHLDSPDILSRENKGPTSRSRKYGEKYLGNNIDLFQTVIQWVGNLVFFLMMKSIWCLLLLVPLIAVFQKMRGMISGLSLS